MQMGHLETSDNFPLPPQKKTKYLCGKQICKIQACKYMEVIYHLEWTAIIYKQLRNV